MVVTFGVEKPALYVGHELGVRQSGFGANLRSSFSYVKVGLRCTSDRASAACVDGTCVGFGPVPLRRRHAGERRGAGGQCGGRVDEVVFTLRRLTLRGVIVPA